MITTANGLSTSPDHQNNITTLIVEDDQIQRTYLEQQIKKLGHNTLTAESAEKALELLTLSNISADVILMDRMMPGMDGVSAVRKIKAIKKLRKIPIIMVTASNHSEQTQEGLDAGVFYYLAKPVDEAVLNSVLKAATRETEQQQALDEELKKHRASFNLITTAKFSYSKLEEAESLAAFIAHCFPEPERVVQGLGALFINALEHGNLGIGYELKSELLIMEAWRSEVTRRQMLAENAHKKVEVIIGRKGSAMYVVVTDEGEGFEWRRYLSIDPTRASDSHGRGIAQARTLCFDSLTYNEKGNQAVALVGKANQLEW